MSDKIELLPCPLCGTSAGVFRIKDIDDRDFDGIGVCCETEGCVQIGLRFACGDDPVPQLIDQWNRRVALAQQPAPVDVPDGFAIIPTEIHLSASDIELINGMCGDGDEDGGYGPYQDGTMFVGFAQDDDGKEVYGLHLSCNECPEEGVVTLAEFAAPAAPAPVAQEPVQMHHEPHNRAMWHENCPGRRFSSPMKPRGDGSWECGVCGAVGRVTAPPSAEQPNHSGDANEMVWCSCGDGYQANSYDAGFIDGSGMCQNCDAALPARDITAPPAAEQPDTEE